MWLDSLYGDVTGDGASKRHKTGTQMGEGNPSVDNVLKPGLLELSTRVCHGRHTEWHIQDRPRAFCGNCSSLAHLFPLVLDSLRHSEKVGRKTASMEGSRENALFSCSGMQKH